MMLKLVLLESEAVQTMDLYQIFIAHNPAWIPQEIVVFSILFIIVATLSGILVRRQRIVFSQAVAGLLLFLFLGIVFGSTVFTRPPISYYDYELKLFLVLESSF